jgi:putative aldouronate transport system permease protein
LATAKALNPEVKFKRRITPQLLFKQRTLILMSFPFLAWLLVFGYYPIWGWIMAFQNFKPHLGVFESTWVGLEHFQRLMNDNLFKESFRNTIGQSFFQLFIGFPMPIIFALFLNEVKVLKFKKATQTISYLPYFVSWVITLSIVTTVLSINGIVNNILMNLGLVSSPVHFLGNAKGFWALLAGVTTWKEMGWNAIIFLAAIAGIDPTLYEAASVDGAGRWRRMWHITLPGLFPIIVILLVINIGNMMNVGFERQRLLGNPLVHTHSVTLDQYALEYGISMARFSYGTAVGMFRSIISVTLVFIANRFARKVDAGVF